MRYTLIIFLFLVSLTISAQSLDPKDKDTCWTMHGISEGALKRTILFRPGDHNSKNYRIPAIITASDGSLVAACDKRKYNDRDLPEDIDILINRSTDGGSTWSLPLTLAEGTGVNHGFGDCALVRSNEEGGLIAVFVGGVGFWQSRPDNPQRTYLCRSHDNGQTWSEPKDITHFILGPDCVIPEHRSWWSSFFASGAGLRTSSGRLMFVAAVREDSLWMACNYVFYSDDDGETWQCSGKASPKGDEAKLVELSDGRILMSIRADGHRLYNISEDGGITWRDSTSVWPEMEAPACNGDILHCTAQNGRTLLLHSLPYGKERKDVSVFVSLDEGKTWPIHRTIVPYPSAYSSLCQLPDGTIGLYVEEACNDRESYSMVFYNFSIEWLMYGDNAISQRPIDGLAHRILGDQDTNFIFMYQPDTVDYFLVEPIIGKQNLFSDDKICIIGNNDNSLAMGLNYYLKHIAGVHVSWLLCEPVELPQKFTLPANPIRREALVKDRFFLNYCTYGYTMPWWKWPQWERFIDWMALNGINMPLAITGQEAVWYEVWKEFGMTDEEIRGYFSGPAHLPWHRMANLDGFGGPLPMSWLDGQKELQQQIVAREREFNMTPVLPAFAGHVPKRFAEMHPEADIQQLSAWCGFEPTYFLNSADPFFPKIQKSFMDKEIALFGTDHIYGVDPFNEMDPPSWEPDYLANVSQNIYTSLQQADPAARWLQMTWVFYYKRKSWTPERLRAYLTAVPQDKLVLLDYFCEKTEVWRTTDGFYGQPFIWCYLGNFGGNTMLVGNINELEQKLSAALEEAGPNMTGIGSTLESFDVSPQIYEYLFDRVWNPQPDVYQWITHWAYLRNNSDAHVTNWKLLTDSIYKDWSFYGLGTQLVARPSLEGHGTYYTKPYYSYNNETLKLICKSFLLSYASLSIDYDAFFEGKKDHYKCKDTYNYDLVNFFSQWMGNHFMDIRNDFTVAYKNRDIKEMKRQVKIANHLFDDVDALLNTHPAFMLGPWIEDARAWGTTPEEKDYYERQARTLLTVWGGPILNDYANRMWGGLVKDYYAKRWNLFFEAVIQAVKDGKEFDEKAFSEELSKFEHAWTESHTKYPVEPQKVKCKTGSLGANHPTYNAAWKIYERWMKP